MRPHGSRFFTYFVAFSRSRVVGCYVALSYEMTPLCLLHYLSLCQLLGHSCLLRDDAAVSVCFDSRFVAVIVAVSCVLYVSLSAAWSLSDPALLVA